MPWLQPPPCMPALPAKAPNDTMSNACWQGYHQPSLQEGNLMVSMPSHSGNMLLAAPPRSEPTSAPLLCLASHTVHHTGLSAPQHLQICLVSTLSNQHSQWHHKPPHSGWRHSSNLLPCLVGLQLHHLRLVSIPQHHLCLVSEQQHLRLVHYWTPFLLA